MDKEELNQYVVFKIGNEEYGVDVKGIKEIVKFTAITELPKAPMYIDGVFNLRGGITPLVNLKKKFGFKSKEIDENARIVIAELGDKPIGMLVDAATEVLGIPMENIETTPDMVTTEISKDYLKGVGKVGDRLIIILDLKQVLTKKDMEEINLIEDKNIMTEELIESKEKTEKKDIEEEPEVQEIKEEIEDEQPKKEPDEIEKSSTNQTNQRKKKN